MPKNQKQRRGQRMLELLSSDQEVSFAREIDVFLVPRPDVKNLKTLLRLVKELDKVGNSLRRVVSEISRGLDAEPAEVIEHMSDLARASHANLGFYNTFVLAIEESPALSEDLNKRREVLRAVTELERDALRVTIARARKSRRRSRSQALTTDASPR